MGYNDFHKGFKASSLAPNRVIKKSFGPRSIDEVIKSRFEKRVDKLPIQPEVQRQLTDYQQNMRGQRNLHNLDK